MDIFCDLDIYYLHVEIMLILQNLFACNKNKNILQQYRVHSFLKNEIKKRTVKLRIHFFFFVFSRQI